MRTDRRLALALVLAAAALLAVHAASAAEERWRVAVAGAAAVPTPGRVVSPLQDGGYLVRQIGGSPAPAWISRFDAEGALIDGPVRAPQLRGLPVERIDGSFSEGSFYWDVFATDHPAAGCRLVGHLFGQPTTGHLPYYGLLRGSLNADLPPLPALELVKFREDPDDPTFTLSVMDAWCSKRTLLRGRFPPAGVLASDNDSAILIDTETGVLRRVGRDGERWSVPLPGLGAQLLGEAGNGDLYLGHSEGLTRIDQLGRTVWQVPAASFELPVIRVEESEEGTVVLESLREPASQFPSRQRLSVIDAAGAVAARRELDSLRLIRPLPSAARSRLWLAEAPPPEGSPAPRLRASSLVTVERDASLRSVASFPAERQPRMELATGLIVESDGGAGPDQLYDPATDQSRPLSFPDVRPTRQILAMQATALGTLVASRSGERHVEVVLIGPEGDLRWQRIWDGGDSVPSGWRDDTRVHLAANAERACLWRTWAESSRITCLALGDGAVLLDDREFPLLTKDLRARLLLDARHQLHAIAVECEAVQQAGYVSCSAQRLVRLTLDPQAHPVERAVLSEEWLNWLSLPTGELVHAEGDGAPDGRLLVRDAAGALVAQYPASVQEILALAPDGRVLWLERSPHGTQVIVESGPSGGWRQQLATAFRASRPYRNAAWLPGGDWLLSGFDADDDAYLTFFERRSGADGALLWRRSQPLPVGIGGQADPRTLVLDAERRTLWTSSLASAHEGRAVALNLADGRPVDALLMQAARPDAVDGPVSAMQVPASDGVISAWVRQGDQSLQVVRVALDTTPRGPTDALAGIWNALDTPGQGLLLQRFPGGALGGAWFTFSTAGGSDDSEMRWFALQGEPDVGGGARLALFEASGGAFAQTPAAEIRAVGEARLIARGCDEALLTYRFTEGVMEGVDGAIPLQRTAPSSAHCGDARKASPAPTVSGGSYFDPANEGQGLLLDVVGTPGAYQLAGAWFTFDPAEESNDAARQHWLTALGPLAASGPSSLTLFRTFGPAFDLGATQNTRPVGGLELRPIGCDLEVTWTFDDSLAAGALAGRTGSARMQRIGGCPGSPAGG